MHLYKGLHVPYKFFLQGGVREVKTSEYWEFADHVNDDTFFSVKFFPNYIFQFIGVNNLYLDVNNSTHISSMYQKIVQTRL